MAKATQIIIHVRLWYGRTHAYASHTHLGASSLTLSPAVHSSQLKSCRANFKRMQWQKCKVNYKLLPMSSEVCVCACLRVVTQQPKSVLNDLKWQFSVNAIMPSNTCIGKQTYRTHTKQVRTKVTQVRILNQI